MISLKSLEQSVVNLILETYKSGDKQKIDTLEEIISNNINEAINLPNFFLLKRSTIYKIVTKCSADDKNIYLTIIKNFADKDDDSKRQKFIKQEIKKRNQQAEALKKRVREREKERIEVLRKKKKEDLERKANFNKILKNNNTTEALLYLVNNNMITKDEIEIGLYGGFDSGKLNLITRYVQGEYHGNYGYGMYIEDSFSYYYKCGGKQFEVYFTTTCGAYDFIPLIKSSMKLADGAIFVFDYYDSLNERIFVNECFDLLQEVGKGEIPKILCMAKVDLPERPDEKFIEAEKAKFNCPFFETSAKEDIGLREAFDKIIEETLLRVNIDESN